MPSSLEEAIRIAYASFPEAVEPILTTQALRFQFLTRVSDLCPNITEDAILQCLVRLRKRGENNGGLPRKSIRKASNPH